MKIRMAYLMSLGFLISACGMDRVAHRTADNTDSMNGQMETMVKNTDEMKQSTEAMKEDTATLKDNMEKMADAVEQVTVNMDKIHDSVTAVEGKVEELGSDARQAVGAGIRDSAWKAMNESEFIERKLAQAGIYFSAFEFQIWKSSGLDTLARRDSLRFDAVSEFLRSVSGACLDKKYSLDVLSKNQDMNDLYAISALLHFSNPNQDLYAKKNGFEPDTMLAILQNGMKKKKLLEEGKISYSSLSKADQEVQVWWDTAVYLLRLRGNYLAAITTFKLARLEESRSFFDEKARQARLMMGPWNPSLDYYSSLPGAVQEVTTYLRESTQVRRFLRDMNIDPKTDPKLKLAIQNLSLDPVRVEGFQKKLDGGSSISKEFVKTLKEFKENI